MRTAVDLILDLAGCTRVGARFVRRAGDPLFVPYAEVLERAIRTAAALQERGLGDGDRVGIVLPTSIDFFDAFLGVQLAGGVPAALYPPVRLGRLDEYYARTTRMLATIAPRLVLTDGRVGQLLGRAIAGVPSLTGVLDVARLPRGDGWRRPDPDPHAPAFLQFSSGTTVEPKAVMVSHANLLANLRMIDSIFARYGEEEASQGGVCWLPLYHDMGLLGCMMLGLYHPGTITYIAPEHFIASPAVWLQTLSRYRAVSSPAPDFAYGLCTAKVRDEDMADVDLSNWRIAMNGAEPIDVRTMEAFARRFARWGFRPEAMTPVYGLAEAGLAVTFSDPSRQPVVTEFDRDALARQRVARAGRGRRLASVGRPLPGLTIEIRDEDGRAVADGAVGTVCVHGPSITRGYYANPELSARVLRDGWLDTGDLGFMHESELYIAGRMKDLIIIRGRNYAPQEIESLLSGLEGLRAGCAVAVGHLVEGEGEQLAVLLERDPRSDRSLDAIAAEARDRVIAGIGLTPRDVRVLAPGTLPRTSSGKLRRAESLRAYLAGELAPPASTSVLRVLREVGRSRFALGRFRLKRWYEAAASPVRAGGDH